MARLNIEDRFFSERTRYLKLSRIMRWSEWESIGHLVCLWHGSQGAEQVRATGEEICDWSEVFEDEEKYLNALCHKTVRYCDLLPNGNYLIRGNEKQCTAVRNFRIRSQKGNAAKQAKKLLIAPSRKPSGSLVHSPITITTTNSELNKFNSSPPKSPTGGCEVTDNNQKDIESENLSLSSPEKSKPKKKQKSKQSTQTKTWEKDNPFSSVFTRLMEINLYRDVLDVPKDQVNFTKYLRDYNISISELHKIVVDMDNWIVANDREKGVKKVRGLLVTFIQRYVSDRNEKAFKRTPKGTIKPKAKGYIPTSQRRLQT